MRESQTNLSRCFNWNRVQSIATLEASRAFRFRSEERGALLTYLGIAEESFAVEVGCGTGILASHLAAGMPGGFMLGIDITPEFTTFARAHRRAGGNLDFVTGDAYQLPLARGVVGAATSYTLLAVLGEPAATLREQMRVTREGGTVSAIEVVRGNIGFGGRAGSGLQPEKARRLSSLREQWAKITDEFVEPLERQEYGYGWAGAVEQLPSLFESVGLKDVRLRGFFSTFSTSDETHEREERRWFLHQIGEEELVGLDQLWRHWRDVYVKHGVTEAGHGELRQLVHEEHAMRLRDFDEGHHPWAWHGTVNLIVAGRV